MQKMRKIWLLGPFPRCLQAKLESAEGQALSLFGQVVNTGLEANSKMPGHCSFRRGAGTSLASEVNNSEVPAATVTSHIFFGPVPAARFRPFAPTDCAPGAALHLPLAAPQPRLALRHAPRRVARQARRRHRRRDALLQGPRGGAGHGAGCWVTSGNLARHPTQRLWWDSLQQKSNMAK